MAGRNDGFYGNVRGDWLNQFSPPIPTTFDKAIDYYEQLRKCFIQMQECLHYLRHHEEAIQNMVVYLVKVTAGKKDQELAEKLRKEFHLADQQVKTDLDNRITLTESQLQNKICQLKSYVDCITGKLKENDKALNKKIEEVEKQYAGLENQHKTDIARIDNDIVQIYAEIAQTRSDYMNLRREFNNMLLLFTDFKSHVLGILDESLDSMEKKLEAQVTRVNGDIIMVTNPISGTRDTLKKVLDAIYDYKTPLAIKKREYDDLHITKEEYDAMRITKRDYDNFGKLIFLRPLLENYVTLELEDVRNRLSRVESKLNEKWVDAITGKIDDPYNCYRNLANLVLSFHADGVTMKEYRDKHLTMAAYADYGLTVREYLLNAGRILK